MTPIRMIAHVAEGTDWGINKNKWNKKEGVIWIKGIRPAWA